MTFVLGTAGHIDHGKSTLVKALTGIDPDRLPIEKQRGITTELGFAHLVLDGQRLAVVDVPGHERFVKSMVAGAAGVDLACLVIACDEGVMPQTREHLDICDLLAIGGGVVALTKRDLIDDDLAGLLHAEVTAAVAGTFLEASSLVEVSARAGAGLAALRAAIASCVRRLPARRADGVLRLPIDRIFTVRGFGTVVTGTLDGGAIALGDDVEILPRGETSRVRGLEVHGEAVERAAAGARVAVNLGGLAVDDLVRGDVLAHSGRLAPSHILDVQLRHLAAARSSLPRRSKVLVHHGTTQLMATIELVDAEELAPGAVGLAQVRVDAATPLAALPGDRFIVRGFAANAGSGTTLGGGTIVRVQAPRARARSRDTHADALRSLAVARVDQRMLAEVRDAGAAGRTVLDLGQRIGLAPADVEAQVDTLSERGDLVRLGEGTATTLLHPQTVVELEAAVIAELGVASAAGRAQVSREELRTRLPRSLPARGFDLVLAALVRRGAARVTEDTVQLATSTPVPAPSSLEATLRERFTAWRLEPPRPNEIAAVIGAAEPAVKASLERLLAQRALIKVKPDYYADAACIAELRTRLLAQLDARGEIDPQAWKELTGTSRKFSIPLAEYFDAEKVTLRVGDVRRRRR